jgi:hypothetical protein
MPQADECRTKAQECEEIARQHRELELKQLWEDCGRTWRRSGTSSRRRPKAKSLGVRAFPRWWRPAGPNGTPPSVQPPSCSRLSRQVALSKKWMGIFVGE